MLGLAGILTIMSMVLWVVSFVAGIWLIVVAFKRSVLWGLLSMLVPFASLVFTIKYWQEARKPFLTGICSGIAAFVMFLGGVGTAVKSVTPEMAQQMMAEAERQAALEGSSSTAQGTAAPNTTRAAAMPSSTSAMDTMPRSAEHATSPSSATALSVLDTMPPTVNGGSESAGMHAAGIAAGGTAGKAPVYDVDAVAKDGFAPVALADAGQLIGRRVKVVTNGGQVHEGEMRSADAATVSIERWLRGGSAVLDFSKSEIESIRVRAN